MIKKCSDGWSDFVVVILGWWIPALRSNDRSCRLQFMDGPYSLRISRTSGGLGLGLSIARHLVELHGGVIEASSEGEGCGATFTVTFPFRESLPVIAVQNVS